MNLRPYQQAASDSIFKEWEDKASTMIVVPTGGGKTVIFADVIKRMQPKRCMVIAHREELIWQARDAIERWTGLGCEVEMADLAASTNLFHQSQVVLATVQTLNSGQGDYRRMQRFNPMDFGCLIVDENHHSTASSYRAVIDHFKTNPNLKILGVTATPDRTDEEALGQVFESVAYDYEILDAIQDGFLVPVYQQVVNVAGLDYSAIRTTCGDLNGADLAAVMEAESNLQGIAGSTMEIIGNRRTLVFAASVKQAEVLCDIFNRYKPKSSKWVCGATPKEERREVLGEFASGTTQIMVNVGVLLEGYDNPNVEVIVMACPTKSRSRYSQMAGRATRPLPGIVDGLDTPLERRAAISASPKPNCLLLDFVGNSGKHKLMTSADILAGNASDEAVERATMKARAGGPFNMADLIKKSEEEIKGENERREAFRAREAARKVRLVASVKYNTKFVNPFDVLDIQPQRARGWDAGKTLTEKQRNILLKAGVNPDNMPYQQARQVIGELFRRWGGQLSTIKQCALLRKHGYDGTNMTMKEASATIDAIAKNGWRRPDPEPVNT